MRSIAIALAGAAALAASGCATYYDRPYTAYEAPGAVVSTAPVVTQRAEYGVVEHIDLYRDGGGAPMGLGAVIGGIAGGIIGHQFGAGRGNTAATIGGAVAGGLVGNEVQKSTARDRYRIVVRLDSGGTLMLDNVGEGELRVGDRVRVVNGRVFRA